MRENILNKKRVKIELKLHKNKSSGVLCRTERKGISGKEWMEEYVYQQS